MIKCQVSAAIKLTDCLCRLKESCPLWKSAGCQWWRLGARRSSSPWAERIRLGSWILTCLSSSWSPLDWYTLHYSLVRHTHTHWSTYCRHGVYMHVHTQGQNSAVQDVKTLIRNYLFTSVFCNWFTSQSRLDACVKMDKALLSQRSFYFEM